MDLSKYLALFVAEAGDHLAGLSSELVNLERTFAAGGEVRPLVDSIFRHAHSVKGMSASMQLDGIAALAHKAEDLVDVFRKDPSRLSPDAIDLLLEAADGLQAMVAEAQAGRRPEADPQRIERLAQAARAARTAPAAGAPADRPPRGVDERAAPPADGAGASPPPHRHLAVTVEIAGTCPVPAVRAFLVVKKLSGLGQVSRSRPTVEDLKAGRLPGKRLEVDLATAESPQAIERALSQISDLASVSLTAAGPEAAPAPPPGAPPPAAAPAASPPVAAGPAAPAADAARAVRVKTEILDGFLDAVGELILATARIREIGRSLPGAHRPVLDEGIDRLAAVVKDLHDKVMTVRMAPLAGITERLPRAARDVARKLGKQVEVIVRGAEIEVDRAILEELADPLQHVLRNAVDHGLEAPHLRLLAGKPATGRLTLSARRERDRVILEIADDGKGMDPARLRAAAVARGGLSAPQAAALSDREALQLACLPGVSTAETVTDLSGRGVGLDAVKRSVESVGGTLELDSDPGNGTRVTLRLPLTVAVQPVLLVRVADEVLGLPIAKVHGAAQVTMRRLDRSRGEPVLPYDGELVPVKDLAELLGFAPSPRDERAVVVADAGDGRVGLAVDGLLGQQEAVLKPLGAPLERVPGLSAVTVLGNGLPVFILDVPRLLAA